MRKRFPLCSLLMAGALGVTACSDVVDPVQPSVAPAFDVIDACVEVSGTLTETFVGADIPNDTYYFSGPISGSLEGTSSSALTASDNPAAGTPRYIVFGAGTRTISVTGGSVGLLVGGTLVFEMEQMNIVGGPGKGQGDRMTLVSGARRGHLTVHGGFDFATFTYSGTYHGSICP